MLERFKVPDKDKIFISETEIYELTKRVLMASGVSEKGADNTASVLIGNDMRGVESHGISNGLRLYLNRYDSGENNPNPITAPGSVYPRVDTSTSFFEILLGLILFE